MKAISQQSDCDNPTIWPNVQRTATSISVQNPHHQHQININKDIQQISYSKIQLVNWKKFQLTPFLIVYWFPYHVQSKERNSCKKCWRLLLICFGSILGDPWLSDIVSPIPIICITKDHLCCLLISKVVANYLLQRVIDRIQMNMYYMCLLARTMKYIWWNTF